MLQNSSVLSVIPTKRHGEVYREMFPGWCKPACACFSFLSKSKEGSLAFYSYQSLLKSNIPVGNQGPVFKPGWLIEETALRKNQQWTRERATVKDILGFAGLSLSCYLPTGSARFLLSSSDTDFLYIRWG